MAKQIEQIVIKDETKLGKDLIENKIIKQLGIYALPGTQFAVNNKPMIMNGFGIFELDGNEFPITSLQILNTIGNIGEHFIIIDLIYEEVE